MDAASRAGWHHDTTPLLELVDIRKTYRLRGGLLARLLGREPAFDALGGIT